MCPRRVSGPLTAAAAPAWRAVRAGAVETARPLGCSWGGGAMESFPQNRGVPDTAPQFRWGFRKVPVSFPCPLPRQPPPAWCAPRVTAKARAWEPGSCGPWAFGSLVMAASVLRATRRVRHALGESGRSLRPSQASRRPRPLKAQASPQTPSLPAGSRRRQAAPSFLRRSFRSAGSERPPCWQFQGPRVLPSPMGCACTASVSPHGVLKGLCSWVGFPGTDKRPCFIKVAPSEGSCLPSTCEGHAECPHCPRLPPHSCCAVTHGGFGAIGAGVSTVGRGLGLLGQQAPRGTGHPDGRVPRPAPAGG